MNETITKRKNIIKRVTKGEEAEQKLYVRDNRTGSHTHSIISVARSLKALGVYLPPLETRWRQREEEESEAGGRESERHERR